MPRINVIYFMNKNLNKKSEKGPLKKKEKKRSFISADKKLSDLQAT